METVNEGVGQVPVFVVLDHATCEGLGIHVAKIGNRFEVLDPLRPAIQMAYGFGESVA